MMEAELTPAEMDVQRILERVRSTIRKAVPGAEEVISYQIPTYKLASGAVLYPRRDRDVDLVDRELDAVWGRGRGPTVPAARHGRGARDAFEEDGSEEVGPLEQRGPGVHRHLRGLRVDPARR